ncbi:MAG TPA: RCC1 domain-containing protein, partial [Polyangia bacterium]|nr:RCC1 domain-containing protein [Polyangia bacterium]
MESRQSALGTPSHLVRATSISSGTAHSCALLNTGEVACWGRGHVGQLGTGHLADAA